MSNHTARTFRVGRRSVFHVRRGQKYHLANSRRGVLFAKRHGFKWIDLDCHTTKDGVLVITHWPKPMVWDDFYDPKGRLGRHRKIHTMTWRQVKRLRTRKGGYVILPAKWLVQFALDQGVNVELELKSSRITKKQLEDLHASLSDPDRVQVKTLATLPPRPWRRLEKAKAAGFKTIILGRGRRVPKDAQAFIDYRRGPVRWTR